MAIANTDNAPFSSRPPTVSYEPSIWRHFFTSFSLDDEVHEKDAEAINTLKEDVRIMLMDKGNTTAEKLVLVDTLDRLGVSYHFEQEIEEQLHEIFKNHQEDNYEDDYDLFTTALQFRLLRQHCYNVSCRVFDKFMSQLDKKFDETLENDAKGLLSLYEAAHLRMHREDILEEAVVFTTHHLNRIVQQLESPLQDQVKRALVQPLFKGVLRIETRYFISFYEKDGSKSDLLLKFAKLDFNYVQNIYKKDLCELSRWSLNVLDLKTRLPYARDRIVELYLWLVGFCYKPQYSYVRIIGSKILQLSGIMDDTYDNYATLEEAELFTELLQRWDTKEIDPLPDYMKVVYRLIVSTYEDFERDATARGKSFAVPYAIEAVKQLSRAYITEFKWSMTEMPTFEEYLANTYITTCSPMYHSTMFVGMESADSKESFDWLMNIPKVLIASSNIVRLQNDIVSYERENKGGTLNGAVIYAKQHCISIQETMDKLFELGEDSWKDATTEWITNTTIPKDLVEQIINYARGSEMGHREVNDGFTDPREFRSFVTALFVDPIII